MFDIAKKYTIRHKQSGRLLTAHRHYGIRLLEVFIPFIIDDEGGRLGLPKVKIGIGDKRNSGSTYVCVCNPGWDGHLWHIRGEQIVFAEDRDGQSGWILSAHRHKYHDRINDDTTKVMIHKPGWDGNQWSFIHKGGNEYSIVFASSRDNQRNWGLVTIGDRNSGSYWIGIHRNQRSTWLIDPT